MSHFSVLVLHAKDDSFEDLLAPFDENLEVKPYLYISYKKSRRRNGAGARYT